jgi:hypothetical protein
MAKKSKPLAEFITLTDDRGAQHVFRPLEIFCVGAKNFAVLQSMKSPKNEATIFRFTLGRDGMPKGFAEPTPKEFDQAMQALGAQCDCGCGCGCESDECAEPEKPARRKAAPRKKARAKKAARKRR